MVVQKTQVREQEEPQIIERYTTVAIDRWGRVFDLRFEHPSWQQVKEEGKKDHYAPTVVNAFTCTLQEATRLKQRKRKKK